jgi:hypothetical protein
MKARFLVTAMAAAVAGVAMYGSAASLHEIAVDEHLAAAWTMPFCLDLLAITTTMAAVLASQRGALVHIGPPIAYLTSLGLQVSAAWAYGPRAWAVHAIPLVAAAYLSEILIRIWAPAETLPASMTNEATGQPDHAPTVAATGDDEGTPDGEPLVVPEQEHDDAHATSQPAAAGRQQPPRASVPLDELVHRAQQAAARRGVAPIELSQATLKTELHIGSNRAKDVYHALRRPALELIRTSDR